MTTAQRRLLRFARDWQPLNDGTIECGLQTGLWGAALASTRAALERRQMIDPETGSITPIGERALAEITVQHIR